MNCKIRWLFVILFPISFSAHGQLFRNEDTGLRIGIVANFGTHVNAIGLDLSSYYRYEFMQANGGVLFRWNFQQLGERNSFFETRISVGANGMFGPRQTMQDEYIRDSYFSDTRNYGLGYNYLWYLDMANSSQRSGVLYARIREFDVHMENDFLAGQGKDRFRTGLLYLQYRLEDVHFYSFVTLWTGDTEGVNRRNDRPELHPNGYKDLRLTIHGETSHGIAGAGMRYFLPYGNTAHLSFGYDAEQIRHFFQNVLIHNKHFTPKAWRKPNAHYPMLNYEGVPALEKSDIRKGRFFMQGGMNYWGY